GLGPDKCPGGNGGGVGRGNAPVRLPAHAVLRRRPGEGVRRFRWLPLVGGGRWRWRFSPPSCRVVSAGISWTPPAGASGPSPSRQRRSTVVGPWAASPPAGATPPPPPPPPPPPRPHPPPHTP